MRIAFWMDEQQTSKVFDFIDAVKPYLSEMAERGDYQAKALLEQAEAIEEEPHEAGCPATDGFGCRCNEPCEHTFEMDDVMINLCTKCGLEGEEA